MHIFIRTLLLATLLSQSATAAVVHPPQAIEAAAMAYLQSLFEEEKYPPKIVVRPIDARLKFPMCELPLEVVPPENINKGGRSTLSIQCEDSLHPWRVYVTANVKLVRDVAVLSRHIPRGSRLGKHDLVLEPKPVRSILGDYFEEIDAALGLEAKVNLSKGAVASPRYLIVPDFIKRGQRVLIEATSGAFAVQASGTAMNSAARDELVRVRNLSSGRVVEGYATKPGTVSLN